MLSEMQKGTSRTTTAAKIAESLKKRKSRSVIAHGIDFLEHHGIIGQKWGVRRYQNEDGSLTEAGKKRADRLDAKWVKKKEKKTRERALNEALNDKRTQNAIGMVNASYPGRSMYKTNGQLKASYTNQINRILADSMTEKVSNMRSPSGRVISFVAATGSHKIGDVYTAFSDEGYDFSKLKNGINSEGKLSYKRKKKENYLDMMEN